MDRFIAAIDSGLSTLVPGLKSNMDRFIVFTSLIFLNRLYV